MHISVITYNIFLYSSCSSYYTTMYLYFPLIPVTIYLVSIVFQSISLFLLMLSFSFYLKLSCPRCSSRHHFFLASPFYTCIYCIYFTYLSFLFNIYSNLLKIYQSFVVLIFVKFQTVSLTDLYVL